MFQKNQQATSIKIQIEVNDWIRYPWPAKDVFNAIMDWSKPINCLHIDLLVTDKILLVSSKWDGIKTIIFLSDKDCPVKSGIIINDGNGLYDVIMSLLEKM